MFVPFWIVVNRAAASPHSDLSIPVSQSQDCKLSMTPFLKLWVASVTQIQCGLLKNSGTSSFYEVHFSSQTLLSGC